MQDALKSYRSETETKEDSDYDETEDLGPEDINQTAIMIKGITPIYPFLTGIKQNLAILMFDLTRQTFNIGS